jgi:hypothetical protein
MEFSFFETSSITGPVGEAVCVVVGEGVGVTFFPQAARDRMVHSAARRASTFFMSFVLHLSVGIRFWPENHRYSSNAQNVLYGPPRFAGKSAASAA